MDRKEAKLLIDKYLAGKCTSREKRLVENWYNQLLKEEYELPHAPDMQSAKEAILERLPSSKQRKKRQWLQVAASLLLLAMIGLFLWKSSRPSDTYLEAQQIPDSTITNQAMLMLSDGTKIILDSNQHGLSVDSTSIRYLDGTILSKLAFPKNKTLQEEMTVQTPKGRQFKIILEDNTHVLLNAASSLTCRRAFPKDKRQVYLEGEGFFEVSKDANRPFAVITRLQEVSVLGTSFGVSAFSEDAAVKTTLLSGSVRVKPLKPSLAEIILSPGEQTILFNDGILSKETVDVNSELSWREGNFSFQSEDIHSVMRKLQRWYNVEVDYVGKPVAERYNGIIPRYEHISKVLEMLEKTKSVHFKIEERRITVMQ